MRSRMSVSERLPPSGATRDRARNGRSNVSDSSILLPVHHFEVVARAGSIVYYPDSKGRGRQSRDKKLRSHIHSIGVVAHFGIAA
jgi:hypothetical protein